MAKIVSMSSGAIDPIAQSKRVFWRPVTEDTVLKVGQPVCYNSDIEADHKERDADPTHLGLSEDTYAEGAQDFTGRLFIVEEPLSANLHAFAGICKALGPKAGADGDMIEIWKPNGAVLPCWIDQSVTLDQTVLGIRNGEADVSYPGTPIGIAKETKDRTTAGLCWVKVDPNMFLYQYPNTNLSVGTSVTDLHHSRVTTANTTGFDHLDLRTTLSGVIASGNFKGVLSYMIVSGAPTAAGATYISPLHGQLNISGTLNGVGLIVTGVMAQVHGSGTITDVQLIAAFWADLNLTGTAAPTHKISVLHLSNNCTCDIGQMVYMSGGGGVGHVFTFDNFGIAHSIRNMASDHLPGVADKALKCNIDGTAYYIPLMDNLGD